MTESKQSLMVREASPVNCYAFLTAILSDGKYAAKEIGVKIEHVGDKVLCVDEKVQVVIDGARGLSG